MSRWSKSYLDFRNPTSFRLNLLHALVRQELLTVSNATAISSDWSEETRPPAPLLTEMSEALLPMQVGGTFPEARLF